MRIPADVLKSVVMVVRYHDPASNEYDPEASGFVALYPSELHSGRVYGYIVTARHVIEGEKESDADLVVSKKGGGTRPLECDGRWFCHPDPSVDVAVTPMAFSQENDILTVGVSSFLTGDDMKTGKVGIGDDVFFPGVFTYFIGQRQIMPIVRTGTIAMLPEQAVQVNSSFAEVYLIEARSIGGISGSPVFVRRTINVPTYDSHNETEIALQGLSGEPPKLLGMIHGHWDIEEREINRTVWQQNRQRGVNLGIAIVVPAEKILEVLRGPELTEYRRELDQEA